MSYAVLPIAGMFVALLYRCAVKRSRNQLDSLSQSEIVSNAGTIVEAQPLKVGTFVLDVSAGLFRRFI